MSNSPLINNDVNDFGQFARLRGAARNNDPEALKAAARQFEALFTQQMLKTARETKMGGDLMGNDQTEFYQGMFDQQIAQKMSEGRGLGIADLLVRQLQCKQSAAAQHAVGSTETKAKAEAMPLAKPSAQNFHPLVFHPRTETTPPVTTMPSLSKDTGKSLDFVSRMLPHAEAAARELGVPAHVLVAQAALETGWGKHQIKNADGSPSYNFFGIKADTSWHGDSVARSTLEYEGGVARRQTAQFRSYDSPEAAFKDYVRFLKSQPRYAKALNHGGDVSHFVHGLQKAGYATDPAYADKIHRIASGRLMSLALASKPAPRELSV